MSAHPKKIRVLLADDHTIVREGIRSCLAPYTFLEIAGEASDGEEAVRKAKDLAVDVALMDINMPVISGLEAVERLHREAPQIKVLVLTVHKNPEYVQRMIRCGARGYVLKHASPEELARAIELVESGKGFFSPEVSGTLLDLCAPAHADEKPVGLDSLSPREQEVLKLVARGYSTKQIAGELNITFRTVETHRERLMRKLGIHKIAGLTHFAIAHGLIGLEESAPCVPG